MDEPPVPLEKRAEVIGDANSVRVEHDFRPDNAIEATEWALRRSLDERLLSRIGPEAQAFWHVEVADSTKLAQRIV